MDADDDGKEGTGDVGLATGSLCFSGTIWFCGDTPVVPFPMAGGVATVGEPFLDSSNWLSEAARVSSGSTSAVSFDCGVALVYNYRWHRSVWDRTLLLYVHAWLSIRKYNLFFEWYAMSWKCHSFDLKQKTSLIHQAIYVPYAIFMLEPSNIDHCFQLRQGLSLGNSTCGKLLGEIYWWQDSGHIVKSISIIMVSPTWRYHYKQLDSWTYTICVCSSD